MSDPTVLLASLNNYTSKVKTAIEDGDAHGIAETERLIDELSTQLAADTSAMSSPETGEQRVAVTERLVDLGAGSALDCWLGNHFNKTITAPTTFSLLRVPEADRVYTMAMYLTNAGAHAITFWPNVYWNEGVKPEFTAAGRDVVAMSTRDGGLTWDAYLLGKAMALPA